MSDWDAARYHRVSEPQFDWGQRVIARLQPAAGERVLDLGCGTGRLTSDIHAAITGGPGGTVVGLDRSGAMLAVARASAAATTGSILYVQGDGAALPFGAAFDAVFSAATLHWIADHPAVFRSVAAVLSPGGRFVAQCGGRGNLARMLEHAEALMSSAPYRDAFREWHDPWNFADAGTTGDRLRAAGFVDVETWLEEAPVDLGSVERYAEFVSCVCIRHHLERLPVTLRDRFTGALTAAAGNDDPPFTLDYQRLNISARKAGP